MTRPVKSWLSINDQVQRLRSRGMDIADPDGQRLLVPFLLSERE
ncbi:MULTISPECIES: hypothetical protein [Mycolicibacterium]|uniref:Uncharacterized protein n=1 Tax=Mycolicibacterium porcinum TaxID=39693 RepID=A0ABV3VFQ6_9MYCO